MRLAYSRAFDHHLTGRAGIGNVFISALFRVALWPVMLSMRIL